MTDTDIIKTAQANLRVLEQANSPWIDEYSLRVASAPLRLLLVDEILVRAWKASRIRGPIQMEAYCFESLPGPDAVGFCGGGDILPGIPMSIGWGNVRLRVKKLNICDFLKEPCICAKGLRITRHELVQYIANTKGVHTTIRSCAQKNRKKKNSPL